MGGGGGGGQGWVKRRGGGEELIRRWEIRKSKREEVVRCFCDFCFGGVN